MDKLMLGSGDAKPAVHRPFMERGLGKLRDLNDEITDLKLMLADIVRIGGPEAQKTAEKLTTQLDAFEPSITMIGQIKAGKTSLVNAMLGRPGLLPADVNPWTSVVTSLHLNTPRPPDGAAASFQFFSQDEWDYLIENGGRIGELSSRAGADEELEKVRVQITEMRDKTKQRLGRKFELLLGQKHSYGGFSDDLIERYVCLGDDIEDLDEDEKQGQFADITKSADLYMQVPSIPMPLCLRDTPGVNDTFMMREQITINALRESRLCVVVLSAHQALSSMDMGLIRLISNVKSRQVVIFVNRIDELSDPANQVPEIRDSILRTLEQNNGPDHPELIFGSAYWANIALGDDIENIVEDSAKAMFNWAESLPPEEVAGMETDALVWHVSGVPQLFRALSERILEGAGHDTLTTMRKRAYNLVAGMRASNSVMTMRLDGAGAQHISHADLTRHLDKMELDAFTILGEQLEVVFQQFASRVDQSHRRFLDRALESLLQHLEANGEERVWQYSPDGLRMLLRTSYQVMRRNVTTACEQVYAGVAEDLTDTYLNTFGVAADSFAITPPTPPEVPAPVTLGQTIALDLQTSWWKGWWKRRKGYRAFASGFYDLIEAETAPIVEELKVRQSLEIRERAESELRHFIEEQRKNILGISARMQDGAENLEDAMGLRGQQEREELFEYILDELSGHVGQVKLEETA